MHRPPPSCSSVFFFFCVPFIPGRPPLIKTVATCQRSRLQSAIRIIRPLSLPLSSLSVAMLLAHIARSDGGCPRRRQTRRPAMARRADDDPHLRTRAHSHGGDAAGSGRAPTACASRRPPRLHRPIRKHTPTHAAAADGARARQPSLCRGVWCRVHPSPRSPLGARRREEPPSAAPPRAASRRRVGSTTCTSWCA